MAMKSLATVGRGFDGLWQMAVYVWQMNPVVVLFVVGLAWALIICLLVRPEDVSGAVRPGGEKD